MSVLANWLFGGMIASILPDPSNVPADAMKMGYFFLDSSGKVPSAFKVCGCFQALCDVGLGVQYWMYGDGSGERRDVHLA